MNDINLPRGDRTPYYRRAHHERAQAAANLVQATIRAVGNWATAIAAAHTRRRLRRETVRDLQALSNRTLQDIGIPRSAIWSVADDLVNAVTGPAANHDRHPQRARPAAATLASVAAKQRRPEQQHTGTHALAGCG